MHIWGGFASALLAVTLSAATARADVAQPEETACDSKTTGAPCSFDEELGSGSTVSGECTEDICSRLVYPEDGGTPSSAEYDCLLCVDDGQPDPVAVSDDEDEVVKGCAASGHGSTELGLGSVALVAAALGWGWARTRRRR